MYEAAEEERFEQAARLRDTIHTLDDLGSRQKMTSVRGEERDIFGFYREGDILEDNTPIEHLLQPGAGESVNHDHSLIRATFPVTTLSFRLTTSM